MKSIIKRIADEAIGPEADFRVVNEAVVRAMLFALLQGRAHRYRLKTQRRARGFRYLYSVSAAGKTISYEKLREMCARSTVVKNVQSNEGLESLTRYTFSIITFMPEHVSDLLFSLSAGSGNCSAIVAAVENLHSAVTRLKQMRKCAGDGCIVRWDKIYEVFRNSFLKAVCDAPAAELECFAYKVFSSKACDAVSEKLGTLAHILDQESIIDNAAEIAQLLGFLSNFDARLAAHHKLSNSEDSCKEFSLSIDVDAVRDAVAGCSLWHRLVDLVIGARMRQRAKVSPSTLAAISMLLNMHLKISSCNVEAILLDDGSVAYAFARSFSFPIMKAVSCGNVSEGILASPAGRSLVDLMIKNHNAREACKFPLSYSEIALVIKHFNVIMRDIRMRESVAYYINEAVCRNPDGNANVYGMAMELVADVDARLKFLQKFVESPDYKYLVDFLQQSQYSDTHEHFRRFLIEKRGYDVAMSVSEKRAKSASRAVGTALIYAGYVASLLAVAGGIAAICYHSLYVTEPTHYSFLIGGIGLLILSIVIGSAARFTYCKRKRTEAEHAAAEGESGLICHPESDECEATDAAHQDDEHESGVAQIAGKSDYIIPVTIECSASINNSIGA
ncbi:hypothetical protein ACIS_00687 [Anaplasma centrale str. Israel]|uniref:Uncharacterized protein n=1 Tax=Anaplasma centrale (strain Israel) TaxID=574556 RepID=D1AUN1_ANACI|nr:hypothetical protein [Anaplasma centrale]ACZ49259.1 hypothetical protein ACIS_00687 [Anaplasma centrale str. Israel]